METLFEFQASQLARAADDIAGYLTGVKVGLTQSAVNIDEGTTLAELTAAVATYTGYASVTVVWDDPSVADDGTVEVTSEEIVFRPTAPTTIGNQVYNLYIVNTGGTILYFAVLLSTAPIPMESNLDQLKVTLRYRPATNSVAVLVS